MFTIDPITQFIVLDNSSPENVIVAEQGTYLYRDGDSFVLVLPNDGGFVPIPTSKKALAYQYYNQGWYPAIQDFRLTYAHGQEIWYKNSGGGNTGWQFVSFDQSIGIIIAPPQTSSMTPTPTPTPSPTPTPTPTPTPIPNYQIFTASGVFTVPLDITNLHVLVVAGGGASYSTSGSSGLCFAIGGGAGGGVREVLNYPTTSSSTINITVGPGGIAAVNGTQTAGTTSSFGPIIAFPGGGGGDASPFGGGHGGDGGGSGGGGGTSGAPGYTFKPPGGGTLGQGYGGGFGSEYSGGGGGGGGGPGGASSGSVSGSNPTSGAGGFPYYTTITGVTMSFAGGGSGGPALGESTPGGNVGLVFGGGAGSGSATGNGQDGQPNTGGGAGGGTANFQGGNGGSGIVIVAW